MEDHHLSLIALMAIGYLASSRPTYWIAALLWEAMTVLTTGNDGITNPRAMKMLWETCGHARKLMDFAVGEASAVL